MGTLTTGIPNTSTYALQRGEETLPLLEEGQRRTSPRITTRSSAARTAPSRSQRKFGDFTEISRMFQADLIFMDLFGDPIESPHGVFRDISRIFYLSRGDLADTSWRLDDVY
uniref:Uncharacterized protein n=1 Tax=Lotharella oceanica TaxID=641309 RepID=A0A7S2X6Z3_9EUKA